MLPTRLTSLTLLSPLLALGCTCASTPSTAPVVEAPQVAAPVPVVVPATYDVHEWGLVRATPEDHVMISGPHANAPMMGLGKPVLYFHRVGEGALEIDVRVHIEGGRIVEHWPMNPSEGVPESDIAWRVQLGEATCASNTYPSAYSDEPCRRLLSAGDICEAATLRTVETSDSTCVHTHFDGSIAAWNHLFYRAEVTRDPQLPLVVEPGTHGAIRLSSRGLEAIGGTILRVVRSHGSRGVQDAALVVRAPQHGESIEVPAPTGTIAEAMTALDASLREAGLTEQETAAFRRAWDATLFGAEAASAEAGGGEGHGGLGRLGPLGGGVVAQPTDSILYVLPEATAEALATLELTPAPREVRRVIVAWVDVPSQ